MASTSFVPSSPDRLPSRINQGAGSMDRIRDYLRQQYPVPGPGAGVFVSHGDDHISEGYGQAEVKARVPIKVDTQFDIASLAKQFTAFCAFDLIRRGRIALNDEVRKHLRQFPFWGSNLTRPTREPTI